MHSHYTISNVKLRDWVEYSEGALSPDGTRGSRSPCLGPFVIQQCRAKVFTLATHRNHLGSFRNY